MKTENRNKRVVFTMGGKGGVGKTGLLVALAEWFEAHEIPCTLLDLDTENKARGSLKHFFNGSVTKVNIHTPAGLDSFIDHLESGTSIILADMGAGSGQVASDWFDSMYEDVSATGARFTAVGVVTPDPASVESVLAWANRLQDRVQYIVVQNATSPQSNFSYWDSAEQAIRFRESLSPIVVRMEFRLSELENPARQHGVRLGQKQLVNVLREVAHPDLGVAARIRTANESLLRNMAARAQPMDDFLARLEKQIWAIWLPIVAGAALALGFVLRTWFASMPNVASGTPGASTLQQLPIQTAPQPQVIPERSAKRH